MKILFPIGTLYPSQQGGPSNTVYWIAKALSSKGVAVTNITSDVEINGKIQLDEWLDTAYGRSRYCRDRFHFLPCSFLKHTWVELPKQDLVHVNALFYPPSLIAACWAKWRGKPIVWSVRGNLEPAAMQISRWKKWPFLLLIRLCFPKDRVLYHATSPTEFKHIRENLGAVRIVEVPNYMELPPTVPRFEGAKPYFLYLGRLHPIKALDRLLAGLAKSSCFTASDTYMVFAGSGNPAYVQALKNQVSALGLEEKIQFKGHVEGLEKEMLFANAYFSILPSFTENFGNVVIESLAQGTPVIAAQGTPWAILEDKKAGFWVDNAPDILAKAIDSALDLAPKAYQMYRKNALNLAHRQFDIAPNIEVWLNLYREEVSRFQSAT